MTDEIDAEFDRLARLIKHSDQAGIRSGIENGVSANIENRFGWTLLMLAAGKGDVAIGRLLIESGATIDKAMSSPSAPGPVQTALALAVSTGHANFVKLLVEHGADADREGVFLERWLKSGAHPAEVEAKIMRIIAAHRSKN